MNYVEKVYSRNSHNIRKIEILFKEKDTIGVKNMPRNVHTAITQLSFEDRKTSTAPILKKRNLSYEFDYGCEFLLHVAYHNPSYKFFINLSRLATAGVYCISNIFVFDVDEPVGSIEYGDAGTYCFYNNRISNDLMRGSCRRTTKLAVAKKIFISYFYGVTLLERMQKVRTSVREKLYENKWTTDSQHNSIMSDLQRFVEKEFTSQDSTLLQYLETAGQKELLTRYVSTKENKETANRLKNSMDNDKGLFVLVEGDIYCTWEQQEATPRRIKRVDLSPDMRIALGLLKVADQGTVVDGAGYKINDNAFFIMKEVNLEFDD
jgi:hypothetical protein